MQIRIHWHLETGRVSANCPNHSVTLIRQTRSHLEDLVKTTEDILTVKYTGKRLGDTVQDILTGDLIEVDPIDWQEFCVEFEQLDEYGNQVNKNEFAQEK
jgi:hypothetical protein